MKFRRLRSFCFAGCMLGLIVLLTGFSAFANGAVRSSVSKVTLAHETDFGLFSIAPPQGYRYQSRNIQHLKVYLWAAPHSQKGPLQGMMVNVAQFATRGGGGDPSVDFLAGVMDSMGRQWTNLHAGSLQRKRIHGQLFLFVSWTGTNPKGVAVRGFYGASVVPMGAKFYSYLVMGQDLSGSHQPILQQAYQAVQTLQVRPKK